MSTQDPNTTATAPPSATPTKKPASLKAVTGFGNLDPNMLANTAHKVAQGIGGNPLYFPNTPIDPKALDASGTTLTEAVIAAMDGAKTAKAVVKKQRKLVIQDLNLLAVYVQNVSNDDPTIFAASGFTAKPIGKSAPQPVGAPTFRSLDYGVNSGQIVVAVKAQAGAKSYFIRYAVMNGTTPGAWMTTYLTDAGFRCACMPATSTPTWLSRITARAFPRICGVTLLSAS
jgi:hypothetical protein